MNSAHRQRLERGLVGARGFDRAQRAASKQRRETARELLEQLRDAFLAAAAVTDRIVDGDALGASSRP